MELGQNANAPQAGLPLWSLEHDSLPAIQLHLGENVLGRAVFVEHDVLLPFIDFVSREQFTIVCFDDGSAQVRFSTRRQGIADESGVVRGNNKTGFRDTGNDAWQLLAGDAEVRQLASGQQLCFDAKLAPEAIFTVRREDPHPAPHEPMEIVPASPAANLSASLAPSPLDPPSQGSQPIGFDAWLREFQEREQVTFDEDQLRCLTIACRDRKNVFFTGPGGVGKSLVSRAIIDFFKCHLPDANESLAVTAPTGIAATHIGGTTLHSATGVGVPVYTDDFKRCWGKKDMIRKWKVLILDEVSMLAGETWEFWYGVLMKINHEVQLIFCGDHFQLPPISKKIEPNVWRQLTPLHPSMPFRLMLRLHTRKRARCLFDAEDQCEGCQRFECCLSRGFAFQSQAWWDANFVVVQFSTVWRQSDEETVRRLNAVRKGSATEEDVEWFNAKCLTPPLAVSGPRPLLLAPTNNVVDARNDQEMQVLHARGVPEYQWLACDWQEPYLKLLEAAEDTAARDSRRREVEDALQQLAQNDFYKESLCEKVTRMCTGTRCILLVNLDLDSEQKLCNGSLGVMEALASEEDAKAALEAQIEKVDELIKSLRDQLKKASEPRAKDVLKDRILSQAIYRAKLRRWIQNDPRQIREYGGCWQGPWKLPWMQFDNGRREVLVPQLLQSEVVGVGTCYRLQLPVKKAWAISARTCLNACTCSAGV